MIFEKSIPLDSLGLGEGDQIVSIRIDVSSLIVTVAKTPAEPEGNPGRNGRLGSWGRKWAGTFAIPSGETADTLKAQSMQEKFGA